MSALWISSYIQQRLWSDLVDASLIRSYTGHIDHFEGYVLHWLILWYLVFKIFLVCHDILPSWNQAVGKKYLCILFMIKAIHVLYHNGVLVND